MTRGKWEPSAEDLYDYSQNVEALYLQVADCKNRQDAEALAGRIIATYNEVCEAMPERRYLGTVGDLADHIMKWEEIDTDPGLG